ncbi:MAG: ATP-binding protein [Desulfurivibrionaceae bacterium]
MRTVPRDTIADLIVAGESANLQVKSSSDRQVIELPVAFANFKGGTVLVVVNDRRRIVGVALAPKTAQQRINGRLLGCLSAEQLVWGNYSFTIRNKKIAPIFKESGTIEKYDSGVKRIIDAFTSYGLPAFTCDELAVRLDKYPNTVKYYIKKLKDQDRIERIGSDRGGYWMVIDHDI